MPYLWLAGVVYYGMQDQTVNAFLWCALFLSIAWIKQMTIDHLSRMEAIAYSYMISVEADMYHRMKIGAKP